MNVKFSVRTFSSLEVTALIWLGLTRNSRTEAYFWGSPKVYFEWFVYIYSYSFQALVEWNKGK